MSKTMLTKDLEENKLKWLEMLKNKRYKDVLSELDQVCGKYLFDNKIFLDYDCFHDVKPYDNTVAEHQGMNYINASYVNRFVACQEPKKKYVKHFYEFLSKGDVGLIVTLKESLTYFGDDEEYEKKKVMETETFTVEEIKLPNKTITRVSCKVWRDLGILSPEQMEELYAHVSQYKEFKSEKQTIVHCWAGVGRTGTFIMYALCSEYKKEKGKNISLEEFLDLWLSLRAERCMIVQSPTQLELLINKFICDK